MGSLITKILVFLFQNPRFKKELAVKPLRGPYNIGNWNSSFAQAPIYVRATNDAEDRFLQMKACEQTGSKWRIIQGASRRSMAPPTQSEDVKGLFAYMKEITRKVDLIGQHFKIPHFHSAEDVEAQIPSTAATTADEEVAADTEEESNEEGSGE